MTKPFHLVGHRGFPQEYPENTLSGLLAAIAEGADGLEFDIQVSKDGIPVVIHDPTLLRTSGVQGRLADYTMSLLTKISAHEPARFDEHHLPEPIVSLETLVKELVKWPEIEVFAEVKAEMFETFTREHMLPVITKILQPLTAHCRVISFDYDVLPLARNKGFQVGWVLEHYSAEELAMAHQLKPEFLICDIAKLPTWPQLPWPGPWQWFVYDIVDAEIAANALKQGVRYLETWDIAGLKKSLAATSI